MKITTKWFGDQFNIGLASAEGRDEFLSIKGCRIKSGEKGEFISWPAQKKDDGTFWRHVWGSDEFQAAVIRGFRGLLTAASLKPQRRHRRAGAGLVSAVS